MPEVALAGQVKDWLTSAAIVVGGAWAIWRFSHAEWLRQRAEIPSLEGNSRNPEIYALDDNRVAVCLRWTWRNAGTRPVYIDDEFSFVEIISLKGLVGDFIDPRQQKELLDYKVAHHFPLKGYGSYMLEPNTTSTMLTVPILPAGEAFIARHKLYDKRKENSTNHIWRYSWERWQVFRTDLPDTGLHGREKSLPAGKVNDCGYNNI